MPRGLGVASIVENSSVAFLCVAQLALRQTSTDRSTLYELREFLILQNDSDLSRMSQTMKSEFWGSCDMCVSLIFDILTVSPCY